MKICPKCKKQYESGNFCEDCENEDSSPVKLEEEKISCPQCGKLYEKGTKFCSDCGFRLDRVGFSANSGLSLGDKNVIAGDVSNSVTTNNTTYVSNVTNADETKKVIKCHICGAYTQVTEGYDCPDCHLFTCSKCYNVQHRLCFNCLKKITENSQEKSEKENLVPSQDMIYVQGGKMLLGREGDYFNPEHEVTIYPFYISKFQVTQELYERVTGENPSNFTGKNSPVENISWYDAVEFCNKLSLKEGFTPCYKINKNNKDSDNMNSYDEVKWTVTCNFLADGYRLPTEAEWEYAARGGQKSEGYIYSGSDDINEAGWNDECSDDKTHSVGQKKSNELGLYDMSGNVMEWCWDWYNENMINGKNPIGAKSGKERVFRGGSWLDCSSACSSTFRNFGSASFRGNYVGFRLVSSRE